MRLPPALAAALLVLLESSRASAFCGFYVAATDRETVNEATTVVLMRQGPRTVLSMQNHYKGPPERFAMLVPVPVVLEKEQVKTLEHELFAKVDRLASPRLVEYWEQDPCPRERERGLAGRANTRIPGTLALGARGTGYGYGSRGYVRVDAQFAVGEYDVEILSTNDALTLDDWLRAHGYQVPDGLSRHLRPYVEAGMKFFAAKVDVRKVQFDEGRARLSPLRVHYDTESFQLPVRLGLINSDGVQDLLVHILAPVRYEVANYDNVTIPTNLVVDDAVRRSFGPFYAALFDRMLEHNPRAVVTEYSWDAGSCDPCPGPTLTPNDVATLGGDVIGPPAARFVLTRLHYRYGKDTLGDDLVFRSALPIAGGQGTPSPDGDLLTGVASGNGTNRFQARYVILHPYPGKVACDHPTRGFWGGPPEPRAAAFGAVPATDIGLVRRTDALPLEQQIVRGVGALPERGAGPPPAQRTAAPARAATPQKPVEGPGAVRHPAEGAHGSGCAASGGRDRSGGGGTAFAALFLWIALARRRAARKRRGRSL